MQKEVETERFLVKTDTGKEYIIIQYQEYISVDSLNDPHAEIKGLKRLATSTGLHVNYINPETFKVVETNEIVRKVR
jgi:hypothetical protein